MTGSLFIVHSSSVLLYLFLCQCLSLLKADCNIDVLAFILLKFICSSSFMFISLSLCPSLPLSPSPCPLPLPLSLPTLLSLPLLSMCTFLCVLFFISASMYIYICLPVFLSASVSVTCISSLLSNRRRHLSAEIDWLRRNRQRTVHRQRTYFTSGEASPPMHSQQRERGSTT